MEINLNADLGESFGRYKLGNDEVLAKSVKTVSVACGYHAADPSIMHNSVKLAKKNKLDLVAHVAFPDLVGFGRRKMFLSKDEVCQIVIHQIGGLLGFCLAEKVELKHVKPHGQLALMSQYDKETAQGLVNGVKAVDMDLMLLSYGNLLDEECNRKSIRMIHEGFIDLNYNKNGELILERDKQKRDIKEMSQRAINLANKSSIQTISGNWIKIPIQSICVHGDGPNASEIAEEVRKTLITEGHKIVGLNEIKS